MERNARRDRALPRGQRQRRTRGRRQTMKLKSKLKAGELIASVD
jgi:hypothetical protein